jgi:hypothetical protein
VSVHKEPGVPESAFPGSPETLFTPILTITNDVTQKSEVRTERSTMTETSKTDRAGGG